VTTFGRYLAISAKNYQISAEIKNIPGRSNRYINQVMAILVSMMLDGICRDLHGRKVELQFLMLASHFLNGLTLITCSTCTYNSVFSFGLCLPVRGRLSPNTQIMICRLVNTGVVVVVPDRMRLSAEKSSFRPKIGYFCRNKIISAEI